MDEKKLTIIVRVEAGCLGPQGDEHIAGFCEYANLNIGLKLPSLLLWQVIPRTDKNDPELGFAVNGKKLTEDQAQRYLAVFDHDLSNIEQQIFNRLPDLIDRYHGR